MDSVFRAEKTSSVVVRDEASDFSTAVHTAATRAYVRTFGRVREAGRQGVA